MNRHNHVNQDKVDQGEVQKVVQETCIGAMLEDAEDPLVASVMHINGSFVLLYPGTECYI